MTSEPHDPKAGPYLCGFCEAQYHRADHLTRHVRSHTDQRPYVCLICSKGFARQDLLRRHESIHVDAGDESQPAAKRARTTTGGSAGCTVRVSQACRRCAAKKLKCTDEKPCKRCRQKQIVCEHDHDRERSAPGGGPGVSGINDVNSREATPVLELQGRRPQSPGITMQIAEDWNPVGARLNIIESTPTTQGILGQFDFGTTQLADPHCPTQTVENWSSVGDSNLLRDVLDSVPAIQGYGNQFPSDADSDPLDLNLSFWDSWDTSWLPIDTVPQSDDTSPSKSVTVCSEAYRRTLRLLEWKPGQDESSALEQQDLLLPENVNPTKPLLGGTIKWLPREPISVRTRDQLLSMIFGTIARPAVNRIITTFPSLEILTNLIHHAFLHIRHKQVNSFIHLPSFNATPQRPELLGAIIALGAICSPITGIRKFGYALQEVVRVAVLQRFEEDNATLREHGMTQAFYLQHSLALFSGVGRKIELAESFSMLGVSILRRGKRLCAAEYPCLEGSSHDFGETLRQRWLLWAECESMIRLVYFALTLDAHVSMSRNTNMLFSNPEMEIQLPCSDELWMADSELAWKEILLSSGGPFARPRLSMIEALRNIPQLSIHRNNIDLQFAGLVVLGGIWNLVRDYHQTSLLGLESKTWNSFVLVSRHTELCSAMQQFRMETSEWGTLSPELRILQEIVSMHLHVAFYEISKYIGRGNEDEAQDASSYVQRWFQSSASRSAVWHAGQVIRGVKMLPGGSLNDIYAIALFHAGVILWIYGLMWRTNSDVLDVKFPRIVLDGDETPELTRFVNRNRCIPGLTGQSQKFLTLYEPAAVTDFVRDLVQVNWKQDALPFTTWQVSEIMQGLSEGLRRNGL